MGLLKQLFTNCACPQGRMGRAMLKFSASKLAFAFGLRKRSQLSTAKCTFTGDSFQNHDAKVRISEQNSKYLFENF